MTLKDIIWNLTPPILVKAFHYFRCVKSADIPKADNLLCNVTGQNFCFSKNLILDTELINSREVNQIEVQTYMPWRNPFDGKQVLYQFSSKIYKNTTCMAEVNSDFNNYGFWITKTNYYNDKNLIKTSESTESITAPEYNIAFLSASAPVITFLSMISNITSKERPTIIFFERNLGLDFFKLPKNVYLFPWESESNIRNCLRDTFWRNEKKVAQYVGLLYKLNPKSFFHIYLCEHQNKNILELIYANSIPDANFEICLLSDGLGSYVCFNRLFGNESAFLIEEMISNLNKGIYLAKILGIQNYGNEDYYRTGDITLDSLVADDSIPWLYRFGYACIWAKTKKNVYWIVNNKKYLELLDSNNLICANIINYDTGFEFSKNRTSNLLFLQSWFNFDFSSMIPADEKKICIMLGTNPETDDFFIYAKYTVDLLGSGYTYFYKGHPGESFEQRYIKEKKLEEYGIRILNCRIPTELLFLFYPSAYVCGYESSAFLFKNALNNPDDRFLVLWNSMDKNYYKNGLNIHFKYSLLNNKEKNCVEVIK